MSETLITLKVVPNFYAGHTYLWEVEPAYAEPMPWEFQIEQSDVPYDDHVEIPHDPQWKTISPSMTNLFAWVSKAEAVYTKEYASVWRVRLTSGKVTTYSEPHTVFADIDRDSWMIIREIQRKEVLAMQRMSGTPCQLYQRKQTGIQCLHCISLDTGEVLNPSCPWCLGTGKLGGYHGPYPCWGKFEIMPVKKSYGETDAGIMTDIRKGGLRFLGNPHIFQKDIVIDTTSDRRYYVGGITPLVEIRRMPIVQELEAVELATQDIAYRLGTDIPIGSCK